MKYTTAAIEQLMEHEFAKVEGDLGQLRKRDLESVLPKGMTPSTFLSKAANGEFLLLTDTPARPLVVPSSDLSTQKGQPQAWQINPTAEANFQPASIAQLKQRILMSGHAAPVAASNDSLPPPSALHYTPEPVRSDDTPQTAHGPIAYEYNIEIAFSEKRPSQPINLHLLLMEKDPSVTKDKTVEKDSQMTESNWQGTPTQYGTKYTITSHSKAPRRLSFRIGSHTMGLSLPDVSMVSLGAGTINEAFVPIMPTVQWGERLGFINTGYLYHFQGTRLVQEYKWIGKQGFSPLSELDVEHPFNLVNNALLVYWKIGGNPVTDQYLVYRPERLSKTERHRTTEDWLKEEGVHLDIDAILAVAHTPIQERTNATQQQVEREKAASNTKPIQHTVQHTVQAHPDTGQRETLSDIAAQYGTTPAALITLNPRYRTNLAALKVGMSLLVKQAQTEQTKASQRFEYPPEAPSTYNNPNNSYYDYSDVSLYNSDLERQKRFQSTVTSSLSILPIRQGNVKRGLPLVNIQPERILRIGVFFDGTGQNNKNDEYKEHRGDKSRTNIARLFEAYPEETGKHAKLYVSGVGTLDGAWQTPSVIDAGNDETRLSSAFGLFDENGAYTKWQSLLISLRLIVTDLIQKGIYDPITHIAFDVFGFSRGAALARHFVNALKEGLPDYAQSQGRNEDAMHPNLLGGIDHAAYHPRNKQYGVDTTRTTSVRFLGVFDTVGSFYYPGNEDEGNFQLTVQPKDVGRAFQIVAHHEYRTNFPLTSLKTKGALSSNIYEEVFPGAHTDVGGGYPFVKQYSATDLPERYGTPTHGTYNREMVKVIDIHGRNDTGHRYTMMALRNIVTQWQNTEANKHYGQAGIAKVHQGKLYCYRLQPIDASLAGLAQERMKQQAEAFGVEWIDSRYSKLKDYDDNPAQKSLWKDLRVIPLGSIQPEHWQGLLPDHCVHRSHDTVINPGCSGLMDGLVNGIANVEGFIRYHPDDPLKTPSRDVYDND